MPTIKELIEGKQFPIKIIHKKTLDGRPSEIGYARGDCAIGFDPLGWPTHWGVRELESWELYTPPTLRRKLPQTVGSCEECYMYIIGVVGKQCSKDNHEAKNREELFSSCPLPLEFPDASAKNI
jgi:hypothetical protein